MILINFEKTYKIGKDAQNNMRTKRENFKIIYIKTIVKNRN